MRVPFSKAIVGCTIAMLLASTAPVAAQYVQVVPAIVQETLRASAARGPNQLLTAIYNSVKQYPQYAQAIVNEAARYQPGMGQAMANIANTALHELPKPVPVQRASESRFPSPSSQYASSGLGVGGWTAAVLAAGAIGAGVAVGVGGGGGGSSSAYDEFGVNWGPGYVFARTAQARGATGAGVLVAVADTGIDTNHPDLVGKYTGGLNVTDTSNVAYDPNDIEDNVSDGHGTFVSGIIAAAKDGALTQGMAYDATILPIRIFDGAITATPAEVATGVSYAIAQSADVYNGSYGYSSTSTAISSIQTELDAYASAAASGMVMVFATGNDGLTDPYLPALMPYVEPAHDGDGLYTSNTGAKDYSSYADRWLAVVAVNEDGTIASYSNRCGVAAAWCIAAPGTNIVSDMVGGGLGVGSGTSFAAPMVSGAVAMLMDKYPSLTPAQVVTRLLTTATKTGIYASAITFGQGLLNLSGATAFVATPIVPLSATLSGPAYTLANSQFQLAAPFGDGLKRTLSSVTFKPVDSFDGAAIDTNASQLVGKLGSSNSMVDGIRRFGNSSHYENFEQMGDTQVSWQQVPGNDRHDAQVEARMKTAFTADSSVSIGYMDDPSLGFGLSADGSVDVTDSRSEGAFLSPYLAFAQDGVNTVASTKLGDITVRGGTFTGHAEDNKSASAYGAATELSYAPWQGSVVNVQAGFVNEDKTFLGTESSGAFALGQTSTTYAGASARLHVAENTELVGSFFIGTSNVAAAANSLVQGLSGVQSNAFTLGAIQHNVMLADDRLGFVLNQPLRVSAGRATLALPDGVDAAHNVSFTTAQAGLTPSGRELDVEAFYRAPLGEQTAVNASLMLRHQPDNVADAPDEVQALLRWQKKY